MYKIAKFSKDVIVAQKNMTCVQKVVFNMIIMQMGNLFSIEAKQICMLTLTKNNV